MLKDQLRCFKMPKKVLEEILASVADNEKKEFDEHLSYRNPTKKKAWQYENWQGVEGGTEKIFNDVYQSNLKYVMKENLAGKKDPSSVRKMFENIILEAMLNSKDPVAEAAAKAFKAAVKAGDIKSDDDAMSRLFKYADEYLDMDQQNIFSLKNKLESGDKYLALEGMKEFIEGLKKSVINRYIQQHMIKVSTGKEHKFNAYVIDTNMKKYSVEPESMGKELMKTSKELLYHHDQIRNTYSSAPEEMSKLLGYKRIDKDKEAK
jgi:hypothetical protein